MTTTTQGQAPADTNTASGAEILLKALTEATRSLETIQLLAGKDDTLEDMMQVRAYATSRAMVANVAIAAFEDAALASAPAQPVAEPAGVLEDAARRMFDAGWKAAARFCDRDDVVADGIIGFGACPQFEAAFLTARAQQKGQSHE